MTVYFFDDQRLYGREGVKRQYEQPKLLESFYDGRLSTQMRASFTVMKDGKYCLLYQGTDKDTKKLILALAESDDGVNFRYVQDIMDVSGCEIADIKETEINGEHKYVMLLTKLDFSKLYVDGTVWMSDDLIKWTQLDSSCWNDGCEPVTGIFKNKARDCYTIIRRPFWGERRLGYVDTKDFVNFTKFEHCLQVDSIDKPLEELYGMPVLPLEDIYVGFPLIYGENKSSHGAKFNPGTISPQLAYSFDGHHWQRSLRNSYLSEYYGQPSMFWVSSFAAAPSGKQLIYVTHSHYAHGEGFSKTDGGYTDIYETGKNRFISLATEQGCDGFVTTRENYITGGNIFFNLNAEKATVAVYESKSTDEDVNALGFSNLIEGFSHEDCIPFRGDSIDWTPEFKNHSLKELAGRTVSFEIRMRSGKIFTISGDILPVMNTVGARIRQSMVNF